MKNFNVKQFAAVIFDMDGVLVDTESYYLARREEFFAQHGVDISHMKNSDFIGANMKNLWPKILKDSYDPERAAFLNQAYLDYKDRFPLPYAELLFSDTKAILQFLQDKGVKVGLASSSSMHDIELCLDTHDLRGYFAALLSGNDFKVSKPNPAIYLAAMEKLQVKPEQTLIIEDSQNGIAAGKDAGATVWAIHDERFNMAQERADRAFPNLTGIMQALEDENLL